LGGEATGRTPSERDERGRVVTIRTAMLMLAGAGLLAVAALFVFIAVLVGVVIGVLV
jgi:hypothetical protein